VIALLSSMMGNTGLVKGNCDILAAIIDGKADMAFYQGHRD